MDIPESSLYSVCSSCEMKGALNKIRKMMDLQQHHNNYTTSPHMGVGPSVWSPLPCEGMLCNYCGVVV
jgi:hypothetical protein